MRVNEFEYLCKGPFTQETTAWIAIMSKQIDRCKLEVHVNCARAWTLTSHKQVLQKVMPEKINIRHGQRTYIRIMRIIQT